MIPNSLPGLDFGLGNDIDMLRETVGAFSRDKDRAARRRDRPLQQISARAVAAARRARPARHHGRGGMGRRRHGLSRPLRGDGGDFPRLGGGRPFLRRAFQSLRQPDQAQRQRRAEETLSAEAHLRRACRRARDVGAECRLRCGVDAHRAPSARATAMSSTARKCGSPTVRSPRRSSSTPRPIRTAGARGITAFIVEKGFAGFSAGAEARQARHARLRHQRARVRGLRSAGRERARCRRQRRQRADVGPRLRARGARGGARSA